MTYPFTLFHLPPTGCRLGLCLGRWFVAALALTLSLRAQNYGSHMNSAERAREAQRYESALLQGTYNNPMLSKSTVDMSIAMRGLGQAQRDEDAAKLAKQQAEQQRRYDEQRERERQAATEAYYRARQEEARRERREFERNFAAIGMRRWGFQDLVAMPAIGQNRDRVRAGQSGAIALHELYATALALRRTPLPPAPDESRRSSDYLVAQLALQALAGGQILPAVLLADDFLTDRQFLRLLACEGTAYDRMLPVYYTGGHGWIADDELQLARTYGLVTSAQLAEAEETRVQLKATYGLSRTNDPRVMVQRVLARSELFPWQAGRARLSYYAQIELAALRETRPVLGYFITALYEERMRYDPARPSPWADFMFERAAQLAGPGFVAEVGRIRREGTGAGEAAAFRRWGELRAAGGGARFAELDAHTLWRVAGRLILGHGLADFSASLADLASPVAIAQRLTLAHAMLWELTTRGDRHALTLQYLAALQDDKAARPSLLAYLNAYHWLLGWDFPPSQLEDAVMPAASFLEALPASQLGRHYADSVSGKSLQLELPDVIKANAYAMRGDYLWYSTGYLESLPMQAAIVPAVILHRNRLTAEAAWLDRLDQTIRPAGFGARLARQHRVAVAQARQDAALEKDARERLARHDSAAAAPGAIAEPRILDEALERFGETSARRSGSSLLRESLPFAAAPDSRSLLEAVALRNIAVKPFLPYARLVPFSHAARTGRFARDSAVRRMVATQGLHDLDGALAASVNLPAEALVHGLKAGAEQGDALCRLRMAQIVLRGGPLAGLVALTTAAAEKSLEDAVAAGVPGAVEFHFERMRSQSKTVPPDQLIAFVQTAWQRGSPLAAQAWLDSLDAARAWTPEQAARETAALRIARDDVRPDSIERWWKALGNWSVRLRANRSLLLGRPEADVIAREVTWLVQQCDAITQVYPKDRLQVRAYDIFPHLATASGSLPASPAATGLREALTSASLVRDELRYGSFVPLETALDRARTETDPLAREFAAIDAARWYAVNTTSRVENAGLVLFSLLPAEPDRHPLWDPAIGVRFAAAAFSEILNERAQPEEFASNVRKMAGLVERLPGVSAGADLQALVNGYAHFTSSAQFRAGIRELPEAGALVAAFDRLAQRQAGVALDIYRASARIAARSYTLECYERVLQPGGTWVGLHRECFGPLTAADHVAHLRRIAGFGAARLHGGATDIMEWATDATAKAEKAGDKATLAELGAAMREVAARWSAFPVETSDRWGAAAFVLTAHAERIAPALEKSAEVLRALQSHAATLGHAQSVRGALLEWTKRAVAAKSVETLRALVSFAPKDIEEAIDELEGSPRRKAAQAEYERKLTLLEPLLDMLKEGRNVPVAVRTLERLVADGMTIHAWSQLYAVKAATLGSDGVVTLPTEPRTFRAVVRLLADGCTSWESEDEIKAIALALNPVAQRLWATRESWLAGGEHNLMWIVRSYARMEQAWAVAAWGTLKENPTPELRYALTTSGYFRELGVPPVTQAEAKLPIFLAADRAQKDLPLPGDDPVAEFEALRAAGAK